MAVDIYLKVGPIKGESQDTKHKEWIDVLSYSWGATQTGTGHLGGGIGAGKVNVNDLSITHYVDAASPELFLACAKGTHFDQATLKVRKAGDKPLDYIIFTMAEVFVTGVQTSGSGSDERVMENVSLNFTKIKFDYIVQDQKGGAGANIKVGWDMAKNDKW
jgi:type VI secretion system secreted protein Hcp